MAQVQIKKVNSWHERLADWLIANPAKTQGEAAKHFGVTQAWLSVVKNSDAFQDYFRQRSDAASAVIIHGVKEKMLGAADQAVSELSRRLEHPQTLTMQQLLDVTDTMTKRTMAPQLQAAQGPQQLHLHMVPKAALAEARAAMRARAFEGQPAIAIGADLDLDAVEVGPDGEAR